MAKKTKPKEPEMNDQPTTEAQAQATQTLTIDGLTFTAPAPYAEGHTLNVAEANTLNQVFAENLRNNFRKQVSDAKESAQKSAAQALASQGVTDEAELKLAASSATISPEAMATLTAEFSKRAESYEFAGRRGSRAPADPIERELNKIARDLLRSHLKSKNIDIKTLVEGQFDKLVEDVKARKPELRKIAEERVRLVQTIAGDILG